MGYKLTYFNIRGLAEPIRFLLAYGGIDYEDERIQKEQWAEMKESFEFGALPVLTADGKQYNQNVAICRFVAKKANLMGKDNIEDLEIDGIIDTISDMRTRVSKHFYETDETKKAALKNTAITQTVPYYFDKFEEIVKNNKGHLACNKLTWADLYMTALMQTFEVMLGDILAKYPNIKALHSKVLALPAIKKWVENRPVTDM